MGMIMNNAVTIEPHEIVVFLGPSLAVATAKLILPTRYLPPVGCGDVLRCLRLKPKVIAIIDGVFENTPAVWHKEILLAMEQGIQVFGASSMGALRAAELAPFGMIGVGKIFTHYRDGIYTDDDEVALLHSNADGEWRPFSEPMVNIRATVGHALQQGVIAPTLAEQVINAAKQTFYYERSLRRAVESVRTGGAEERTLNDLLRFAENGGYVDQKQRDALELIQTLARLERPSADDWQSADRVNRSRFICLLQMEVACHPFEQTQEWMPEEEKTAVAAKSSGPTYRLLCDLA
jgi:hypothetical protein